MKKKKSKKLGPTVKCLSSMITISVFCGFFLFFFFTSVFLDLFLTTLRGVLKFPSHLPLHTNPSLAVL